jgi:FkbM family methyltransferase
MLKRQNLIYDVGMHRGEDTDYYLKKGFKVIAFEADPNLAAHCRSRFADEIRLGKLQIVEGAIVDSSVDKNKTVKFFANKDNSVWGTVVTEWALRNEYLGASNDVIEVQTVDFSDCLKQYGMPYYLKIDIEGMDVVCLKSLQDFEEKPAYISIESEKISFSKLKQEFHYLSLLGYTKFQAINQVAVPSQKEPANSSEGRCVQFSFQEGASGLFGSDLPNIWKSKKQILRRYRLIFLGYLLFGDKAILKKTKFGSRLVRFVNRKSGWKIPGWFDTHAKHSTA